MAFVSRCHEGIESMWQIHLKVMSSLSTPVLHLLSKAFEWLGMLGSKEEEAKGITEMAFSLI